MNSNGLDLTTETGRIVFTLNGAAPGAPRMTQRDKWMQRPCVMAYRGWCDQLRTAAPSLPIAADVDEINIVATYSPPESWSPRRRQLAIGTKKRSKPDGDNILKAVCDALWNDDHKLGDKVVCRRWGEIDQIQITILPVLASSPADGDGREERL